MASPARSQNQKHSSLAPKRITRTPNATTDKQHECRSRQQRNPNPLTLQVRPGGERPALAGDDGDPQRGLAVEPLVHGVQLGVAGRVDAVEGARPAQRDEHDVRRGEGQGGEGGARRGGCEGGAGGGGAGGHCVADGLGIEGPRIRDLLRESGFWESFCRWDVGFCEVGRLTKLTLVVMCACSFELD